MRSTCKDCKEERGMDRYVKHGTYERGGGVSYESKYTDGTGMKKVGMLRKGMRQQMTLCYRKEYNDRVAGGKLRKRSVPGRNQDPE